MKRVLMIALAVCLLSVVTLAQGSRITICHIPPGNQTPQGAQTITISSASLDAHLAHGDFSVPCEALGPTDRSVVVFGSLLLTWAGLMLYRRYHQMQQR